MQRKKSIELKAAFLLAVFSMNLVIGFACAVGLDMGFNSNHHEESSFASASIHHHDANIQNHQTKNDKDNCCNDEVMNFQKVDKALSSSIELTIPDFFTAYLAPFYNLYILSPYTQISDIKYFVRSYHPPIPDIRIAIQSFQI
jgi:hypothetical protein